ncbi:hypothetical protein FJT64_017820 [Amphibalanus amphitrite]|uniref:Uncharacterized protein n=1 Tax=Amphibalanus amphitrite TaxID=1232801 RepID=A0A6A4WW48_AMPAM|nr:hypothetical protein FJT64_017820 [Amphibalanus amphitrite]
MTPMERRLPSVKVWLTPDGNLCLPHDDQSTHLHADHDSPATITLELDCLSPCQSPRRPTARLDAPRRKSSSSCASARSSARSSVSSSVSPAGSRRSSGLSQRSCSVCSRCSRGRLALVLAESRRSSRGSRRSSSSSSAASRLIEAVIRSPRRSSTLSRLSEVLSLTSARHSVLFERKCCGCGGGAGCGGGGACGTCCSVSGGGGGGGGGGEESWSAVATAGRLTFTQRLAFPTLAGKEVRHKRRSHFSEAEEHMNLFAKLITVVILCLVFVLLVGVIYRFLR